MVYYWTFPFTGQTWQSYRETKDTPTHEVHWEIGRKDQGAWWPSQSGEWRLFFWGCGRLHNPETWSGNSLCWFKHVEHILNWQAPANRNHKRSVIFCSLSKMYLDFLSSIGDTSGMRLHFVTCTSWPPKRGSLKMPLESFGHISHRGSS